MKVYTRSEIIKMLDFFQVQDDTIIHFINKLEAIELPTDEEIESKYNKFIDDEIQLGFLKQEQGERLKWYYKTYFIDKIQGGNK